MLFLFALISSVHAMPTIRFPTDKTVAIPNGMKVHFGDAWVSTTSTAIHIQAFFEDNWFNYTVDNAGTQQIYNGTEPDVVWLDGTHHAENDGWTYISSTITIIAATSQAQLYWNPTYTPPYTPPQTYGNPFEVLFKVFNGKDKINNCEIRIIRTAYKEFVETVITDTNGEATAYLQPDTYDYTAKWIGKSVTGSFVHGEQQTITINFASGQTEVKKGIDRAFVLRLGIGAVVIIGVVLAVTSITKGGRRKW